MFSASAALSRRLLIAVVVIAATTASAQWTQPNTGGHINNTNSGFIGIGTTTPAYKLDVFSPSVRMGDGGSFNINFNMPAANTYAARFRTADTDRLTITGAGNVGIGNAFPEYVLDVNGIARFGLAFASASTTGAAIIRANQDDAVTGYYLFQGTTQNVSKFHVDRTGGAFFNGEVVIGSSSEQTYVRKLTVHGDIDIKGNIAAKYQDLAEWVPATEDLAPGTVVVLSPGGRNEVMASTLAYDTRVAGVVSAQPGIILGEESDGMEKIATTGRVKVRVDAAAAPIRVGDLLVTSSKTGAAMRSEPLEIAGRRFHQPGTIIGKALEPLDGGEGEILVLLSMQ